MIAGPTDITVAELNQSISCLMAQHLPRRYCVHGEWTDVSQSQAGHLYFNLKDKTQDSTLACVMYRPSIQPSYLRIPEGSEVIVLGTLQLYAPTGTHQIISEFILEKGTGLRQHHQELLKQKLALEGLFAPERKRPLPFFPRNIGLITSETGAAVKDFMNTLTAHNFSGNITLFPSLVQGLDSLATLKKAFSLANTLPLDALVLTRGGGSSEDLSVFNQESLIRTAMQSKATLITAIGHATDSTLTDAIADIHVMTPTAAAWQLIHRQAEVLATFHTLASRFQRETQYKLSRLSLQLEHHAQCLVIPLRLALRQHTAHCKTLSSRLAPACHRQLSNRITAIHRTTHRLQHALEAYFSQIDPHLYHIKKRLESYDIQAILKRGFVLVKDEKGRSLQKAKRASNTSRLSLQFSDGNIWVVPEKPKTKKSADK